MKHDHGSHYRDDVPAVVEVDIKNVYGGSDYASLEEGPDAKTVVPDLDVVTMAVKAPENVGHLHYWIIELSREASAMTCLMHSDKLRALRSFELPMASRPSIPQPS
jgi:hypothetical protein